MVALGELRQLEADVEDLVLAVTAIKGRLTSVIEQVEGSLE